MSTKAQSEAASGAEPQAKRPRCDPEGTRDATDCQVEASDDQHFLSSMEEQDVPPVSCERLLPLLRRWGPARLEQVLALWTLLGDGPDGQRSTCLERRFATALHVWGPSGVGKTEVVSGFLNGLDIRHIWINCFCLSSQGELHSRLVKLLAREADAAEQPCHDAARVSAGSATAPSSRQLRPIDRLQAALRGPLDTMDRQGCSKVVIVLDHIEELPRRLGHAALELLLSLPETLHRGNMLSILTIGQVPLTCGLQESLQSHGLLESREPPDVSFRPYSDRETEDLLLRLLSKRPRLASVPRSTLQTVVSTGLMKFAVPHLGRNLQKLLEVGQDVLLQLGQGSDKLSSANLSKLLGEAVVEASKKHTCFIHPAKVLDGCQEVEGSTPMAVASCTVRRMTNAEKRLVLAAYLGSRVDKQEDRQLFVHLERSRRRRVMGNRQKKDDGCPNHVKAPRTTQLSRLLAIYHRLARKPRLLSDHLFQSLVRLKEAGLLRGLSSRGFKLDSEPKVLCEAEIYLARACAKDLKVDLAEYLVK